MILKILGFDFEFKNFQMKTAIYLINGTKRISKDFQTADKYRALLQEKG